MALERARPKSQILVTSMSAPPICTDPRTHATLNLTLGALLLGCFSSAVFYGVLCQQCLTFYKKFTRERLTMPIWVAIVWAMATVHVSLEMHVNYTLVITDHSAPVVPIPPTVLGIIVVNGLTDVVIRGLFLYRLWILSGKQWLLLVIPIASSAATLATTGYIVYAVSTLANLIFTPILTRVFAADVTMCIVTDFYTAAGICWFLWRERQRAAYRGTRAVITTIMVYTVNTGLITSIAWLVCLITHATMPNSFIGFGFYLSISNLYSTCLLASLNARDWFRDGFNKRDALQMSSLRNTSDMRSTAIRVPEQRSQQHRVEIMCEVSKHTDTEDSYPVTKPPAEVHDSVF